MVIRDGEHFEPHLRRGCGRRGTQWFNCRLLSGARWAFHSGTGAARDRGRLPRVDYFLYCQHAAAGSDPRLEVGGTWVAHGALRSRAASSLPRWTTRLVVGGPESRRGGAAEDFG